MIRAIAMCQARGSGARRRALLRSALALALGSTGFSSARPAERISSATMVELVAPPGQDGAPLPEAIQQVSRQTGLTLVIRDTPEMRKRAVDAGRRELSALLRGIGSAARCDVHRQGNVVGLAPRLRTDRDADWDRFFMEWDTFARVFQRFNRSALRVLGVLTPEQRWRLLGGGETLRTAELAPAQKRVLVGALQDQYGGPWPETFPEGAILTARWQVYVQLRCALGNYSALLREGMVGQQPSDAQVRARLLQLLRICDDVVNHPLARLASDRMAPGVRALDAVQIPGFDTGDEVAESPSLRLQTGQTFTLGELAACLTEQTGIETHADRGLTDREVFVAAGARPVDLASFQTGVAWAADAFWRSVGPVDIVCPQSFFIEGWRRLRGLWELRSPTHRAFDEEFIPFARLWMPEFLSLFPDSHLYAGLFPYRLGPRDEPRWRETIARLKGQTGKPVPDEALTGTDGIQSAVVHVQPELVFELEGVREEPVGFGASPFQDDSEERDRLFGNA